ncbi:MAG: HutP family protein [Peptococcaceae bacterium]
MKNKELLENFNSQGLSIGNAAMLLALTWNLSLEDEVKKIIREQGYKYAVTEVGGKSSGEFQEKTIRSVMGACLNNGLIQKVPLQTHALLHATSEAKKGILVNAASSVNIAVKIAIVRNEEWIAVAMFGHSAFHPVTNHERAGLGVMHISC